MIKVAILIGATLLLAAPAVLAQAPPDSAAGAAQASPPPAKATPSRPNAYRFGSISGSWLIPSGDFEKAAGDGWAITLEGFQFIDPAKKIAIGSQVGYQSFGEKNGVSVSNFPVDAVLKFYPKAGAGKVDFYATGGLGFNYTRTDVGFATNSDYYFGTQAGLGLELHTSGPVSLMVDAVYHWVFASPTDLTFAALRGGIVIPMMR